MKTLKTLVEKEVVSYVKDVRPQIRKMLESSLLSLIGLEKRNGDIEIDHCNGRNSVLIDAFRNIAIGEATEIAKSYKPTKEDIAGFRVAFEREYKRQVQYVMSDMVRIKVQEDVQKIMNSLKIDTDNIISELIVNSSK